MSCSICYAVIHLLLILISMTVLSKRKYRYKNKERFKHIQEIYHRMNDYYENSVYDISYRYSFISVYCSWSKYVSYKWWYNLLGFQVYVNAAEIFAWLSCDELNRCSPIQWIFIDTDIVNCVVHPSSDVIQSNAVSLTLNGKWLYHQLQGFNIEI